MRFVRNSNQVGGNWLQNGYRGCFERCVLVEDAQGEIQVDQTRYRILNENRFVERRPISEELAYSPEILEELAEQMADQPENPFNSATSASSISDLAPSPSKLMGQIWVNI